jgi:hypothetical protein
MRTSPLSWLRIPDVIAFLFFIVAMNSRLFANVYGLPFFFRTLALNAVLWTLSRNATPWPKDARWWLAPLYLAALLLLSASLTQWRGPNSMPPIWLALPAFALLFAARSFRIRRLERDALPTESAPELTH